MSSFFNDDFMLPIEDQNFWNSRDIWTGHELVYLFHEIEPLSYEIHLAIVEKFKSYYPEIPTSDKHNVCIDKFYSILSTYYKISRHAKSLPFLSSKKTHVCDYYPEHNEAFGRVGYEPRFLIKWLEQRGYMMPSWVEPIKSIHESDDVGFFDTESLMTKGWFNVNKCRAPKLLALIQAYVKEESLCKKSSGRHFSTGSIKEHLKADFDIVNPSGDTDDFLKKLSHVASISPSGTSLLKKEPR